MGLIPRVRLVLSFINIGRDSILCRLDTSSVIIGKEPPLRVLGSQKVQNWQVSLG